MAVIVRKGSLSEALQVLKQLPEFAQMKDDTYYDSRLNKKKHLILVAEIDEQVVGCKIGYDRDADGSFYSWLGGVLSSFRQQGVAKMLSDKQEGWAKREGFKTVKFKTLNRHKAMLQFALKNGFDIYNINPKDTLADYRIELIKTLE